MPRARLLCLALAAFALVACMAEPDGTGSNTNWLRPCERDAACGERLACRCGVCAAACDDACSRAGGVCASSGDASHDALCAGPPSELRGDTEALCLPACSDDAPCGVAELCLDGACVPAGAPDEHCPDELELSFDDEAPLLARQGMAFSDSYYLPVSYPRAPEEWSEPDPWPRLRLTLTAAGQAVSGCAVHAWASGEMGRAYLDFPTSDAEGHVTALWVAGSAPEQRLSLSATTASGRVVSASRRGHALPHDAPPLAEDETARAATAEATLLSLHWSLGGAVAELEVRLRPRTFPHHAFYGALALDGMFAGLQNTSDHSGPVDASAAERVLIFSVWNGTSSEALLVHSAPDVICGAHEQDEGGIRCNLEDAWSELDRDHTFVSTITLLAEGESGPDYAARGYSEEPCSSPTGCKDYALSYARPGEAPREIAVLRRPQGGEVTSAQSFLQPYASLEDETSCWALPRYDVTFDLAAGRGGVLEPIRSGELSASLAAWSNAVCLNYGAGIVDARAWLASGGKTPLGPPQDFSGRTLSLETE